MWPNHPLSQPNSTPPPSTIHVPPGSGKPSTHSRNKRRRKKKRTDTTVVPPKGISETNTLPLGAVRRASTTTKSVINSAAIPLPSSPTHGHATFTSLPNTISTSGAAAATVSPPANANAQPTLPSKKRTQRDRDGPAPDVASALNAAFDTNARAGAYYAGQLHRDGAEDGIHSDSSSEDGDEDGGDDTGSRKKQRQDDDGKGKGKQKALERPTNVEGAYITQDQVMMGSLRNKNKKKGFKLSMANPIPRKIVFGDGVDASVSANTNTNINDTANANQHRRDAADEKEVEVSTIIDLHADIDAYNHENERAPSRYCLASPISSSSSFNLINGSLGDQSYYNNRPQAQQQHPPVASASSGVPQLNGLPQRRLIPPSEIQERGELPANMFVTSVDVEADVWGVTGGGAGGASGGIPDPNSKRTKKKNRKLKQQQQQEHHASQPPHEDCDEFHYPPPDDEVELLDYSEDPQPPSALPLAGSSKRNFDWVKVEKNWDTSVPLTEVEQVGEGGWVGWKVGVLFFVSLFCFFSRLFSPCFFPSLFPLLSSFSFCFLFLFLFSLCEYH